MDQTGAEVGLLASPQLVAMQVGGDWYQAGRDNAGRLYLLSEDGKQWQLKAGLPEPALLNVQNRPGLVKLLLHHGADVERRNCRGETPLGYACAWAGLPVESKAAVGQLKPRPSKSRGLKS